jgi:exocyst complex component 3
MQGNEYVSLLSWIMNTYNGADMMMHPEINIDTSTIGPLLDNTILEELQVKYLKVSEQSL